MLRFVRSVDNETAQELHDQFASFGPLVGQIRHQGKVTEFLTETGNRPSYVEIHKAELVRTYVGGVAWEWEIEQ